MTKAYIGDSVYAEIGDEGQLILTTENGERASNTIILEPVVWRDLLSFCRGNWKYETERYNAEMHAIGAFDHEVKALREARNAAVRILEPESKPGFPDVLRIKDALNELRAV